MCKPAPMHLLKGYKEALRRNLFPGHFTFSRFFHMFSLSNYPGLPGKREPWSPSDLASYYRNTNRERERNSMLIEEFKGARGNTELINWQVSVFLIKVSWMGVKLLLGLYFPILAVKYL